MCTLRYVEIMNRRSCGPIEYTIGGDKYIPRNFDKNYKVYRH